MGTSPLQTHPATRFYTIVLIHGEECLAHWNGEHWEMDATCNSVNEMLRCGLLDRDSIQGWIDNRHLRH